MTDPEPDGFSVPVPPAPKPYVFDLAGELFALHQARIRRLDEARAERLALARARAAGLVKRHEAKLARNAEQRALAEALGLSISPAPDQEDE